MSENPDPVDMTVAPVEVPLPEAVRGPTFPIQLDKLDVLEVQLAASQLQNLQYLAAQKQQQFAREMQEFQERHSAIREKFDQMRMQAQRRPGVTTRQDETDALFSRALARAQEADQ